MKTSPSLNGKNPMAKIVACKLGHTGAFLLLAWMTLVQLNDPDPVFWVGLYGVCAVVPALAFFGRRYPLLNWACLAYCGTALVLSVTGAFEYLQHAGEESLIQDMSPEKPYIEIAREFLGTLIALSIIAGYQFFAIKAQRSL